ncbi:MAG: hypothetical protein GX088_04995 [Clostridia bacterium]|nr:hypothetical protein [Clostridia bacterium]
MIINGIARVDKRTKNLVKRLQPNEIAIIDHQDIDEIAADSLIASKVKAVVNASESISGRYPNPGPLKIIEAGILLVDSVGKGIMEKIEEGQEITIISGDIYVGDKLIASGRILTLEEVKELMEESEENFNKELEKFIDNTLEYAKKEMKFILNGIEAPDLKTKFKGKHALIVVRGHDYKKDLKTIRSYIKEVKPVLVGVDGGADALLEAGYKPDIIVGDMDSVSDRALKCGAELVVHAYPDGRAPGLDRVRKLGIDAVVVRAPGTSEDLAMLLAYQKGAQLIVAVGTHSNVFDFLEKGRKGMASTFLVRVKVGSILVDAKGVNKLYKSSIKFRYLAGIIAAALIPFLVIFIVSPVTHQLARLIVLQIKLMLNI